MKGIIIIAVILVIVFALIAAIPTIRIDKEAVISSNAFAYIRAAMYFIPVGTCAAILTIILGLQVWRLIVAIIRFIWDIIPLA